MKKINVKPIPINHIISNLEKYGEKCHHILIYDTVNQHNIGGLQYIALNPTHTFRIVSDMLYVNDSHVATGIDEIIEVLNSWLDAHHVEWSDTGFIGGFGGFVGYDAAPLFLKHVQMKLSTNEVMTFFWYSQVLHVMNQTATLYIIDDSDPFPVWERILDAQTVNKYMTLSAYTISDAMRDESVFQSSLSRNNFIDAVEKIKDEIARGNVYQMNLTRKLTYTTPFSQEKIYEYYARLRRNNPAEYTVFYIDQKSEMAIVSASPERFFSVRDGIVQTEPIKGTRPRKHDAQKDTRMRNELMESQKDHAELLMITDLLRNDLHTFCEDGTVTVDELATIRENPTVFHLVSVIRGKLPQAQTAWNVLRHLFPGGSITGAPKVAAVDMIHRFETKERGLYTGAIGYVGVNGNADFNIVIRTLVQNHDIISLDVGSGIVYDSIPEFEYLETQQKAKALIQVFEEVFE